MQSNLSTQRDKLLIDTQNLLENMDTMLFWGKGQMSNLNLNLNKVLIADLFNYLKRFFIYSCYRVSVYQRGS
ncbi:MAG: hypothetical protein R2807_02705 [Chitinophagales bacterium]